MSESIESSVGMSMPKGRRVDRILLNTAMIWYVVAAIGQLGFVYFIVVFYGVRTFSGDFAGWNDKPLIDGHIAGDTVGNLMFAVHAIGAAAITLGGLLQLVPTLRQRFPSFHRWTGRMFIVLSWILAIGGLWLVWIRGTYLSTASAIAISLNAVLILGFTAMALRAARAGRIAEHRRWALRGFIMVSGVWFLRVGIMAWIILNQGPVGMTKSLSGPADIALVFASFLVPLAMLEIYLEAQRSHNAFHKLAASALVLTMTGLMAIGIFGTIRFMWGPYL